MNLNELALRRCEQLLARAEEARVVERRLEGGCRVIDCGVEAPGGLAAGLALAEVCLAGLGQVSCIAARSELWEGPAIQVWTDQPVAACMAAQYAGWQVSVDKYFAMGSGPMRAACGREELFRAIGFRERAAHAVGVLESGRLPPASVCEKIAADCGVAPAALTLLVAPTASLAGTVQVVARSVETCLHKLHELGFDLARVRSGYGTAPLPPVAADDLAGIGRTNDAVLYGGEVTLWITGDDASVEHLGPGVPSGSSADHGLPFVQIFERYHRDFYQIDPLLFSPAVVTFVNVQTGRSQRFGRLCPEVLRASFGGG